MIEVRLDDLMPGCKHFRWREFLWLPQWSVHVFPTDNQALNLIEVAETMEDIRALLGGRSITVTSGLRPYLYNKLIKGSLYSAHKLGRACDFQVKGLSANKVRKKLVQHLDELGIRMEDLHGSNWIHIDTKFPGPSGRFFPV